MHSDQTQPTDFHTDDQTDRNAMSVDGTQPPKLPFTVVGIGASAGGLEAFTEFFDVMPPDKGMAFVLVQHLSPKRESMIAEILQKHTKMTVLQVDDGMLVEPDHVYVIRPGHTMTIEDGRLHLGESLLKPGHSRPVDDFFRSLAEEQRERAVAIVLSGMGSNGTAGAQAIKVVGGVCIAQEPDSAKYPSMPRSLIDANMADFILKPQEMPDLLLRYSQHAYVSGSRSAELVARRESQQIGEILAVLRARTRHDFTGYKKPTIVRRIQRRMSLTQNTSMADYAKVLRQTPAEVTALSDDLMIHVTGFFRDRDVWEALREKVILPMVAERQDESSIRCWVTACASGEEAYTLAMLLVEAAEAADKRFDIKVFATDMAERALVHARAGIFPGGIESEISAERLIRFFDREDGVYRVKKELRERVVFAPQNLLQDPPFSRIDIVTCRNLLIYLEPDMQQKVLGLLHFGLREGGTLLLGNSETIGEREDLFEAIDKKLRIYRRVGPTRHGTIDFPVPSGMYRTAGDAEANEPRAVSRASLTQVANKLLLDTYTPPAVVVDRHGRIVFFHGETELYLDQPRGEPTRELLVLVRDSVRGTVRVALNQAIETNATAVVKDGLIQIEETQYRIEVTAAPMDRRGIQGYYLISFDRYPVSVVPVSVDENSTDAEIAEELRSVRDELQSTVEELQTSNEELKASNEEVTSINEELQSTNEELETSKEELQSLNEELTTVNAQLQAKMEDLDRTGNDLSSLLSSTDIAVIFLDTQFRIRRYTPAIKRLMDLIPGDSGRPLADMARRFDDPKLMADAATVLETLQPSVAEVSGDDGRWYTRRVLPYRTNDNRIEGVVITFVDVTKRREAEQAVTANEEKYRTLFAAVDAGLAIFDMIYDADGTPIDFRYVEANPSFERQTGRQPRPGQTMRELFPEAKDMWLSEYAEVARTGRPKRFVDRVEGLDRWYDVYVFPIESDAANAGRLAALFRDVTDQKRAEQTLRASEERYRALFNSMDQAYSVVEMIRDERTGQWADFLFIEVNPAFVKQTGMAYPVGKTAKQLLGTPNPRWAEIYGRVADTGVPVRLEEREPTLDRVFDLYIFRLGEADSRRVAVLFTDITQRKKNEAALAASEAVSRAVAEVVPEMLWQVDPVGVPLWHNQRWADYTGQTVEQARNGGWQNTVHPDDRDETVRTFDECLRTGKPWRREHRLANTSGEYRWFLVQGMPQRDAAGTITSWFGSVTDIHEQRMAVAEVSESESQLKSVMESARDFAILLMDEKRIITQWNAGATELMGWTDKEAIGQPGAMIYTEEDRADNVPEKEAATALRDGRAPDERWHLRRDGSRFWGSGVLSVVRDERGVHRGFVKILRDITDRQQTEADRARLLEAEQHARTVAEAANTSKDHFLATLSHELRTPLSAMLIWSKVLQENSDPQALAEGLAAIEQGARAQQKLIDDLLDSARIWSGKMSLELQPVDLGQVIRRAATTLKPAAEAKGIELGIDIGKTVGVAMADADRLQQVIWNLINNAVKFTPAGGRVDVGVWRREGAVEIRVMDNGQGIEAELLPTIFGRFSQGDPTRTRRHGGLGLGLSISRQIIELHGGTIVAASDGIGQGSVFTIRLPLPRTKSSARPPRSVEELGNVRVVLVEDDAQLREVVRMLLQRAGATVDSFSLADPAKASLLADAPDVLLCDIGLPDKDGYALIREIREQESPGRRLPAIAFTAFDRPQDKAHALECGFDDHLAKPVDPARLIQAIHALLKK